QTWMFKHPTPADFFRSMEDASAVDLDWFWRGWFYTTDHVDIAISNVESISTVEGAEGVGTMERPDISAIRNMELGVQPYVVKDSVARDQYTGPQTDPSKGPRIRNIDGRFNNKYFYELTFDNIGGLVMPLIIEFTFADGTTTLERIPAEVWLRDEEKCQKVFMFEKQVTRIELDPYQETADVDRANNYWPSQPIKTRFEEYESSN
ncbi:MAG: M1 family peptidase, partial [Bacteroidota bacterium]|nr:M1 family peptidase [Bacteroidota bacterium]